MSYVLGWGLLIFVVWFPIEAPEQAADIVRAGGAAATVAADALAAFMGHLAG